MASPNSSSRAASTGYGPTPGISMVSPSWKCPSMSGARSASTSISGLDDDTVSASGSVRAIRASKV
jgi:hypothetical protein